MNILSRSSNPVSANTLNRAYHSKLLYYSTHFHMYRYASLNDGDTFREMRR